MDDISAELNGSLQRNILAGLEPQIIFDNLNVNFSQYNSTESQKIWQAQSV